MNNKKSSEEAVKSSLIKIRNSIKKKFRDLNNQKLDLNERITEEYQPIIEPLQDLVAETKRQSEQSQHENVDDQTKLNRKSKKVNPRTDTTTFKSALPPHRRRLFAQDDNNDNDDMNGISEINWDTDNDGDLNQKSARREEDIVSSENKEEVKQKILKEIKHIDSPQFEACYGLRNRRDELLLGNDLVTIEDGKGSHYYYTIRKKQFAATPGLTNLLLRVDPKYYTGKDLETYKEMLMYTNTHKVGYKSRAAIRRNQNSRKYNNIIKQLFPDKRSTKKSGASLKKQLQTDYKIVMPNDEINYTYWDDPNELVDRLRLLLSSTAAGHTGHTNEIISIIEELGEAKLIS